MLQSTKVTAVLNAQSSDLAGGTFLRTPSVIVVEGARDWDAGQVRLALSTAVGAVWTVSAMVAGWTSTTDGRRTTERLDGLGTLLFAVQGPLLFLGNDVGLLSATRDRAGSTAPSSPVTYAAGFRHSRERDNYDRVMQAIDFMQPEAGMNFSFPHSGGVPAFFSGNLASL